MVLCSAISNATRLRLAWWRTCKAIDEGEQAQQSKTINNQTKNLLMNSRQKRKSLLMIQKRKMR